LIRIHAQKSVAHFDLGHKDISKYLKFLERPSEVAESVDESSLAYSVDGYVRRRGHHRAGAMRGDQLRAIEQEYSVQGVSIETGCGASTILLSNLSRTHTTFCIDDRTLENSAIAFALASPLFNRSCVEFIYGPTQVTMPSFEFKQKLDLALIDGPHAFPFAELEYYYIYPHLRPNALLIVDDVHIPTLFNLYRFLQEDKMFSFVRKVNTTAIFRRTESPTFDPLGDEWEQQEFNRRRFPVIEPYERLSRYVRWVSHLVPLPIRAAAKAFLRRSTM
jgi:predicted O-methyltransferase YrrM